MVKRLKISTFFRASRVRCVRLGIEHFRAFAKKVQKIVYKRLTATLPLVYNETIREVNHYEKIP